MLDHIEVMRLLARIESQPNSFYVERNHHHNEGKSLEEALEDLLDCGHITPGTAIDCRKTRSIWYVRYYPHNRQGFYEVWSYSFNDAMKGLLQEIEAYEKN